MATVTTYVQPITQPLQDLHGSFTQLASQHRTINDQLRKHSSELLSGPTNFQGSAAQAFSSMVDYYLDASEKHMQTFDDAAGAIQTAHSNISYATDSAAGAGLHPALTDHVLSRVTHDQIIQQGSAPVWTVVEELLGELHKAASDAGGIFSNLIHFHFSAAFDDLKSEFGDIGKIAGDMIGMVQNVGHVLGSWAETISSAVGKCLSFIGQAALKVADFVTGFSSIVSDIKTIFSGKATLWQKLLAAGDLALNVGMDVSMLFGVGEALKGGELLIKGGVMLGEKFAEDGGEKLVEKEGEELVDKGVEDVVDKAPEPVKEPVGDGGGGDGEPKVTYSRVQGGTPPNNISRRLISVNDDGSIRIPNKGSDLNLSVEGEHAEYFLQKRGGDAVKVQFDLPKWFDDMVKENSVEQYGYRSNPARGVAPKIVDPTTPGRSYEFPKNSPWLDWIEEHATNGRVIDQAGNVIKGIGA